MRGNYKNTGTDEVIKQNLKNSTKYKNQHKLFVFGAITLLKSNGIYSDFLLC